MLTKAEALKAVEKHGSAKAAAKALGVATSTLGHHLKGERPKPKQGTGKSLDEFRAAHDRNFIVPTRIKEGLRALGDGWEYEAQFARLAGVSLVDLGNYRDDYSEHIIVLNRDGKRAWAGTKATADKMREMVR